MIKKALVLLLAVCAAASSFAAPFADPKPIYVSWVPASNSLMAGSKPSIRITLDVAPTINTPVSISTSDSAKVTLPSSTVTATAGSRYVTFPVTLNGVDDDSPVTVSASSGGTSATSPVITIIAASLVRVTFNTSPTVNWLRPNTVVEVKFTLSGPAGPSGFFVDPLGSWFDEPTAGMLMSDFNSALQAGSAFYVFVSSGQTIVRRSITVPSFTGSVSGASAMWQGQSGRGFCSVSFTLQP